MKVFLKSNPKREVFLTTILLMLSFEKFNLAKEIYTLTKLLNTCENKREIEEKIKILNAKFIALDDFDNKFKIRFR